jgi:pimeloyl-ACP methyl ester carboxylesterase
MSIRKSIALGFALTALVVGTGTWEMGSLFMAPSHCRVPKPDGFPAEDVGFKDAYGENIKGWWLPARNDPPTVIIVHGIGTNRLAMVGRANLYRKLGYAVFLFDLPAHGESDGDRVTFGPHEGAAVSGALAWVRSHSKNTRVAVDGVSLGGAGVLLRTENSGFNAVILEEVFPNIHRALLNRLTDRFGILGYALEPPFLAQIVLRLKEWPGSLSPVDRISEIKAPVLVIGGEVDHLTKPNETHELFDHAKLPKQLWLVPKCGHDDFFIKMPQAFGEIVGGFLEKYLRVDLDGVKTPSL